jgi:hypothetical protein
MVRVFIDGVVRIAGETEIIVIKRNERRLWTASMAREDAEATIKQAMEWQQTQSNSRRGGRWGNQA